jgi:hypothetical protein
MDYSQKRTQKDVELEAFKMFLKNEGKDFDGSLISFKKNEPTDIVYDGIQYQITIGDKEEIEERRKITSQKSIYCKIRNVKYVKILIDSLLRKSLDKKSLRADKNTTLLIEGWSTYFKNWNELEKEISSWVSKNYNLITVWDAVYLVFEGKNIKLIK